VYIQDASFVKLREVTLSYQLPQGLMQSLFRGSVTGARAELSGRNLITWSKYPGLDPEVSNFGKPEHQPWSGPGTISAVAQLLLHDRRGLLTMDHATQHSTDASAL